MLKVMDGKDEEGLRRAGRILQEGGLVAFPTETVYGLGGDALNPDSSRKIYEAKGRPSDNPLIVHIYRWEDVSRIASKVPEEAKKIADAFWPGPLTMILPKADIVPHETTGGLDTVAIRMPSHPAARKLIEYAGGFVAAPSANLSGRPSPTQARFVLEDLDGRVDMILDGGDVGIGLESTIIDLTVQPAQILRPGFVTREMLEDVLGKVEVDATLLRSDINQAPRAPGMKYRHYAPKGDLTIISGPIGQVVAYINEQSGKKAAAGERVGVIATKETRRQYQAQVIKCVGSRQDELEIGRRLYAILREFDEEGVTCIYSEAFFGGGYGQAIMNRLLKAAGHKVVRIGSPDGKKGEGHDSDWK